MTTIAVADRSMAGDGRSRTGNNIVLDEDKVKVRRLKDGRLLGHAGTAFDTDVLEEWLNDGADLAAVPAFDEEHFLALLLYPDGTARALNHLGRTCPAALPTAIGTGEEIALGAMAAGASAEEAVRIACRLDSGSGGLVTVLHLDG